MFSAMADESVVGSDISPRDGPPETSDKGTPERKLVKLRRPLHSATSAHKESLWSSNWASAVTVEWEC